MGSQGTTEGTESKTSDMQKHHSEFLLNFMKSYQDITFSTRIQDGISKDNQSNKKGNVWQAEKPYHFFTEF